jgi:rhomboid protease GluP
MMSESYLVTQSSNSTIIQLPAHRYLAYVVGFIFPKSCRCKAMPTCLKCQQPVPVNEEGIAPIYCDACADRAVTRARRGLYTGTLRDFPVTSALMGINIAIFLGMVFTSDSFIAALGSFTGGQLVRWGGNFGPLTLGGDYWRLVTACFVHGGIAHIAINMWCLLNLGRLSERYFGRWFTLLIYLLTGVGGSLLSITYDAERLSVGASGAIFGIAGAIIAALKFGNLRIAEGERRSVLTSVVSFTIISLLLGTGYLGMGRSSDNMAHLGGFVSGLLVGLPLATSLSRSQVTNKVIQAGALVVIALLLGVGYYEVASSARYKNWMVRAEISFEEKDYPAAIAILEKQTAAEPGNAEAADWLGDAYFLNHEPEKAIVAYKKALQLDPNLAEAKENLDELQQAPASSNSPQTK